MNWRVIFYRSAYGKYPIEKFVEDLPIEDAEEVVASIAALKELGNKARRPLADYLEEIKESQSIEKGLFCTCKRRQKWMILTA